MDDAQRDRLAASVIRLRRLPPEQRARVLDRGRRLDRAGPVAAEAFARNLSEWSRFGPDDRQRMLQADVTARALAADMIGRMPPEARAALAGPEGAGPGPYGRMGLGLAVAKAWRERAVVPLLARPPLDREPDPSAPPPRAQAFRELREQVRAAGGDQAPEDLRRRYAVAVLEDRVVAARQAAMRGGAPDRDEREALAALGRALREIDPGAYDAVAADLGQAATRGPEGLERFRERYLPGPRGFRDRGLWDLLFQVEARRAELSGDPRAKADALQASLLTALKVPDEKAKAFLAEADPRARLRLLRELLPEGFGGGGRHGFGHGRGGR
jgi:hypothetical protein